MTDSLRIIATMVAKSSDADALRELLVPAVAAFRNEAGCEGYLLHEDTKHAGRFVTYEAWSDEHALAAHMKSETMQALEPQLKPLLVEALDQQFLKVIAAT